MFEQFCTMPEDDIKKDVKDFYEENLLNPLTIDTLNESQLILGLHNICPLCKKEKLIIHKKDKSLQNFNIVKIYPEKTDAYFSAYINEKHSLIDDANDPSNKIILCKKCSKKYLSHPTIDDFEKLFEVRKELDKKINIPDDDANIYDSITELIDKILVVEDSSNLPSLEMKALKIKEKISEKTELYSDVIKKVLKFYPYIDSYLKSKEFEEIDQSTNFSKIIRKHSDLYMQQGYSKKETINLITEEISTFACQSNPAKYYNESFILVCYFIQHCEVLSYEISE